MASVQAHPPGWAFLLKGRNMGDSIIWIAVIILGAYLLSVKSDADAARNAKQWREDEEDRVWRRRREREWQWEEELRRRRKNRRQ